VNSPLITTLFATTNSGARSRAALRLSKTQRYRILVAGASELLLARPVSHHQRPLSRLDTTIGKRVSCWAAGIPLGLRWLSANGDCEPFVIFGDGGESLVVAGLSFRLEIVGGPGELED